MSDEQLAKTVWPILMFDDALAARDFLVDAFGFVATATYTDEQDTTKVVHGELVWPEGGGVMYGSFDPAGSQFKQLTTGASSTYVVTDDPDSLYERAKKAGAEIVMELTDQDYGSREFSARDPEGNLWSFGTWRGMPPT